MNSSVLIFKIQFKDAKNEDENTKKLTCNLNVHSECQIRYLVAPLPGVLHSKIQGPAHSVFLDPKSKYPSIFLDLKVSTSHRCHIFWTK